jgi:hypothetical protein
VGCGGTLYLLRSLIEARMPGLLWPDAIYAEIQRYERDPSMAFRFIDPYCIWKTMEKKA